jgi:hypothetical protein
MDVNAPLINPWLQSSGTAAPSGQAPYKREPQPAHSNASTGAGGTQAVTNITNIIYNFNLTPSQQLQ